MNKWIYKIVFVFVSFSFAISATETDLGSYHNTFFDEYDTYVKSEQVTADHYQQVQPDDDSQILPPTLYGSLFALNSPISYTNSQDRIYSNKYPLKLFLRNSVWRI